jgi:REP-associated tyrosine transposase
MPRFARAVAIGYPYHLTHRGNRGGDVFFTPADRDRYREWLGEYGADYGLEVWAYCLMSNHVHLVVAPGRADSLAGAIGRTHMRHARHINRAQGWSGHLWANRFYSTALDTDHLWHAVRYVERNPVRAGMCGRAEDYAWSSARAHALGEADPLLALGRPFPDPARVADWSRWLAGEPPPEAVEMLRRCTGTGRPCGSDAFVERLETELGRPLAPRKPGRKPKRTDNADAT